MANGAGRFSLKSSLGALMAAAWLASSAPALAQDSPDELARRHFESGVAYLQEADYDSAVKAFQKAYDLSKRPEILINIATVHERRGDLKAGVTSLEKYLAVAPEGDQRATVEARIANLKKRIEEQDSAAAAAGTGAAPAGAPPSTSGGTPAPAGSSPVADAPPPRSNVPAFVLLGIGGLTAAGAVLTGVLAKSEYDDAKGTCSPDCTDDDVSAGKSLALTSTILTGVAVVSVSIGAVLYFTNQAPEKEKAARWHQPRVGVGFGPRAASASASWQF